MKRNYLLLTLLIFFCLFQPVLNAQILDSNGLQFVNYKNLLSYRAGLSNDYYDISDTSKRLYYYTEIKSFNYEIPQNTKRSPLNISLVIDNSGSMQGAKLEYVKKASEFLIEQMSPSDFISIIEYSDSCIVRQSATAVTDKANLIRIIRGIYTSGSTNMGSGIRQGYVEVKKNFKDGYMNRVLVLSDGQVNRGITKQDQLEAMVRVQNDEYKISLSTFGVGADFNENLMTALAEQGSGNYYFIANPESVSDIFRQELSGLTSMIANNVILKINIPSGIYVEKVYGFPYKITNNQIIVNFRSISALETKGVIVRCRLNTPVQMQYDFSSSLDFQDVTEKDKIVQHLVIKQTASSSYNQEMITTSINHKVIEQGILFESIEMLDMASKEVDRRNFNGARRLLEYNRDFLIKHNYYVLRSIELQNHAKLNQEYRDKMTKAETMSEYDLKMMQKTNKEYNYQMKTKKEIKK